MRNITNRVVTFVITLLVVVVVAAHAHGGKPHLLGTVVGLHEQHLVVKDQQDKEHTVVLTDSTKLEKAGKPATRADLVAGVRVSVHFADAEGKTPRLIKISPAAPK